MAVGLGNPGAAYQDTRHNIGFKTIDTLAELLNVHLKKPFFKQYLIGKGVYAGKTFFLVKPLTFMNRSGKVIKDVLARTDSTEQELIVICDTLDLAPGMCRLKRKGSAAGQKGLASIIGELGTDDFPRLFIGIGRPQVKDDVIDYVLNVPAKEEQTQITEAVRQASECVLRLLQEPIEKVMSDLNKKRDDH